MALIKSYTDERDVAYTNSYWRLSNISISIDGKHISFHFTAYKDKTARLANKQSIGQRSYTISGAEFDKILDDSKKKTKSIWDSCYDWAKTFKDVGTGEWTTVNPNTPNARPEQIMKSFFDGAVDDLE